MAYMITADCIACGLCEPVCENNAISFVATSKLYAIDPDLCTQCVGFFETSQCAETCPWDACMPDPEHPETQTQLLAKYQTRFGAPDAA